MGGHPSVEFTSMPIRHVKFVGCGAERCPNIFHKLKPLCDGQLLQFACGNVLIHLINLALTLVFGKTAPVKPCLHRLLNLVGKIGLFPAEPAVLVGRAAEMPVRRGARVNRLVEIEMRADAARG